MILPFRKIKEIEKRDKYLNLVRELINLWVTVMPFVIRVLGTVPKGLDKGLEEYEISGRIETIQNCSFV